MEYKGIFHLTDIKVNNRKLICFPYAGGNGKVFENFARHVEHVFDVWSIEPPGHTYHTIGEPIDDVGALCKFYAQLLQENDLISGEIFLMGHSLGAYIACMLASNLLNIDHALKINLILCAVPPPHLRKTSNRLSNLSTQELISFLTSIESMPESFKQEPELITFFENSLKAGFRMYESFEFPSNIAHLTTFILAGFEDKLSPPSQAFEWNQYFKNIHIEFLSGNHLFLTQANKLRTMTNLILSFFINNMDKEKQNAY